MREEKTYYFCIADFYLQITFTGKDCNNMQLLPSFEPFRVNELHGHDLLFRLTIDDTLTPHPKAQRRQIKTFDTGNGDTIVYKLKDGGNQFIIKNLRDNECALLIANHSFSDCRCALNGNYNMRHFGLNNALMLIFAFAASAHQTLLLHASLVRQNGYGYAFIAKSGTGKSTQVSLWLRYLPGCDLMNDDNPIVRIIDGEPVIYGGPWSGKTPCYRKVKAKLGAITRIDRDLTNSISKLSPLEAFSSLLTSCSSMKWDEFIFNNICNTITKLVESTGIYSLHCLPEKEAAIVCNNAIRKV